MSDQGELFPLPAGAEPQAPLAMRLRPKKFEHMVGQDKVVAVLRQLTRSGNLPSIILWGPPGAARRPWRGFSRARRAPAWLRCQP